MDINNHTFPANALCYSWRWLYAVSTWNRQRSFFLLSWTTSSPSIPTPPTYLPLGHTPWLPSVSVEEMCLLLFTTPLYVCPQSFSSQNFQDICTAITDFLLCIIFFSRSKMISIYKYMLFPILERKLLLIPPPLHLPLKFLAPLVILQLIHIVFIPVSFLTFSSLLILSPSSSLNRFLSLLCNQKSS